MKGFDLRSLIELLFGLIEGKTKGGSDIRGGSYFDGLAVSFDDVFDY